MSEERHTTCVQVQEDVWHALKETADRKGVSVSDVIVKTLEEKIAERMTKEQAELDELGELVNEMLRGGGKK